MRHGPIARPDLEAGRAAIDEKAGYPLPGAALTRVILPGGGEQDHEIRDVGVADEVLGAVDDPIPAVAPCEALHATNVGARVGLGHGQRIHLLAPHAGQEIALALLGIAGAKNVRRSPPPARQGHGGAAEFPLEQREAHVVEATAAMLLGYIGRVEAEVANLAADVVADFSRQLAGALDLGLERIELRLDEAADHVDDHLLLVAETEIHSPPLRCWAQSSGSLRLGEAANDIEASQKLMGVIWPRRIGTRPPQAIWKAISPSLPCSGACMEAASC